MATENRSEPAGAGIGALRIASDLPEVPLAPADPPLKAKAGRPAIYTYSLELADRLTHE
jgi:hypothetical protein